jgi:hypothetical protein
MVTASQAVPTSTDTGQFLPTGFDPGNGSAKLIVNGTEIRIPSLIAPLHSDIYEVPLVRTGFADYLSQRHSYRPNRSTLVCRLKCLHLLPQRTSKSRR